MKSLEICKGCNSVLDRNIKYKKKCCPDCNYTELKKGDRIFLYDVEPGELISAKIIDFQERENKSIYLITDKGAFHKDKFFKRDYQLSILDF